MTVQHGSQTGPVVNEPVFDGGDEPSLRDLLAQFGRHWFLMAFIIVATVGAAVAYVMVTPEKYTATGELVIEEGDIVKSQSIVEGVTVTIDDIPNEVAILASRKHAGIVIDALGLADDPEFNWSVREAAEAEERGEEYEPVDPASIRKSIVNAFLDRLEIRPKENTRVLEVSFTSADPQKASEIVNSLMATYVGNRVAEAKSRQSGYVTWLEGLVGDLKQDLEDAEERIKVFNDAKGVATTGNGNTLAEQKLATLNTQLAEAQGEAAAVKARLDAIRNQLRDRGTADTIPEVISSPLIQRLREKEIELGRRRAELATEYGDKHPNMIQVRNEIRDLRLKIDEETNKIIEAKRQEYDVARARVRSLQSSLDALETAAMESRQAEIRAAELKADAARKRQQYAEKLETLRETRAQLDISRPLAQIYSRAEIPNEPSHPQRTKIVAIAAISGMILSAFVVLLISALRRSLETPEEVERLTNYRSLGFVPRISGVRGGKALDRVTTLYVKKPHALFSQAMRSIRSTLYIANGSHMPRSVLFTSATPSEGKTTTAMSYAALCASMGEKVLLIDCDFGRPDVHKKMGVPNDLGISNVIMREVDLKSVIRQDERSGLEYITSGTLPENPSEMRGAAAMKGILEELAWEYETIVVDSAPLLTLSDAQILATLVESTVLVVRWRKARTDFVSEAVKLLEDPSVKSVAGFVMSNVRLRAGGYSSGYYSSYSRR